VLNFNGRLALRSSDSIESRQIIGESGAEFLPRYGKGIYKSPRFMKSVQTDIKLTPPEKIDNLRNYWKAHAKPKTLFQKLFG
jgi:DNA segregation ATPase FtsK/SpoIIIE-like protein